MHAYPCTAQNNLTSCMSVTLGPITQQVYLSKSSLWPRKPKISTDSAEHRASSVWFDESSFALTGSVGDALLCPGLVSLLAHAAAAVAAAVMPAAAGAGESAGGMLTARTESQGTICRSVCSSG